MYGWLEGSWDLDVLHYWTDVSGRGIKGEAHFAWVLEGRAVQDTWIMNVEGVGRTYGTTLRVYDPTLGAWRVTWINPVTGQRDELIGRRAGNDVVQIGTNAAGVPIRWSFVENSEDSFHWLGETLEPDGVTWTVRGEFRGKRRS